MTIRFFAGAAVVIALAAAAAWGVSSHYDRLAAREDLPVAYSGKSNPHTGDPAAIAAGAVLFQENCASCHGARADGHGPAAVGLRPSPANFRDGDVLTRHSDAYLFFRVSEGKPGTAMPSFHGALAEDERWAVVAYLRSLGGEHGERVVSSAPSR
jgi:mono/diheme cytochrome c family protein